MTVNKDDIQLDISEKGRKKDGTPISLDRRLFVQFLAFGNCRDIEPLIESLEKANIDGALYLDFNDPYGAGLITMD